MKGFKRCEKGHFYKEDLDNCPYCPGNSGGNSGGGGGGLSDKTQIVGGGVDTTKSDGGGGGSSNDKTQIFGGGGTSSGGGGKTQVFGGGGNSGGGKDLTKTFISGEEMDEETGEVVEKKARATRKITGWIISYTIDDMGVDFRIYEGKNRIGKDPSCEITVATDPTVSGQHAIILFRSGVWYLEDEMSANGTYLNGEELRPRNPVEISDNDVIKVGDTEFKFKTAI